MIPMEIYVYTEASHYGAEEWLLMADESGERAVVIQNYSKFLAVLNGKLVGLDSYTKLQMGFILVDVL